MEVRKPDRRQLIILGVILLIGLALRCWHLANHLAGPLGHVEDHFESSDLHAFTVLAKKIAAGDVLCREGYHPYMDWMGSIAPIATFETWWGGKEIYHQTPLYPYLLAISHALFGSNVPLLVFQVLLSAASLWLLFDLGRRWLDARAGLIAAGIGAMFAPAIVFDSIQLRASLNSSLTLLSIWLLLRLRDSATVTGGILTGACLAGSYLLRPTGLVLLLLAPLYLWIDKTSRPQTRRWAPALAAAVVVVLAPFYARNVIVGAPVFALSTRGPETVIQANSQAADPGFMSLVPAEDYRRLMDIGHHSVTKALATAIDSWPDPSSGWWLWHEWQKILCVFGDYEYQNNVNFYWYERSTAALAICPTFGWFVGFSLVGLVLLARFGRDRMTLWVPLVASGALLAGSLLGFALGRYRIPLAILLTIPAGATLSLGIGWIQQRKLRPVALAFAVALALCVYSYRVLPGITVLQADGAIAVLADSNRRLQLDLARLRPQEAIFAAKALHAENRISTAVDLLDAYAQTLTRFAIEREVALRAANDPNTFYHLMTRCHHYMMTVAQSYHDLQALPRRDAAAQLARQFKSRANALRGN